MSDFDFWQENNNVRKCSADIYPLNVAFNRFPELVDRYAWSLIKPAKNKLTRQIASGDNGYLIVVDGTGSVSIQTCFAISQSNFQQIVHNLIVVKAGAHAVLDTQCQSYNCSGAAHLSLTEIFLEKGARLDLTMTHCWEKSTDVRPLTVVEMAEESVFNYRYICQQAPRSLISDPLVKMNGDSARFNSQSSLLIGDGAKVDIGGRAIMRGEHQSARLASKIVSRGGKAIARGEIVASGESKGHIECDGLILTRAGRIKSVPVIEDVGGRAELSHEAAIGKLNPNEVEYLMTRGLAREQAVALLVDGFMAL